MKKTANLMLCIIFFLGLDLFPAISAQEHVKIWEEDLVLPTYQVGEPDNFPRFYHGRAYQGAQGRIYPYPILDKLTDDRQNQTYTAVYLENEYIKLCVLPELGGRIFSARDKTNDYDIFYRQSVIKPALIGMLGAWVSGGVEWNIPHHHRATSFLPMDYTLQDNPDGSKTIWIGELELRHRMTWAIGLTLFPGKSFIESHVKIFNRTPYPHSILYWANVAVHTNNNYQVIFPPLTEFATYHGKNQFTQWPISQETYNRTDYTQGVDISWWKNHPGPSSFFAWNYDEDFLAGYDHGQNAGVLHVADHHIMPGKKFWTWGTGSQGQRWETILSDSDGPYLELMVGAYSDNQPDYSWIQPYETKDIRHYWYPIQKMRGVKAANLEAAVNLNLTKNNKVQIDVNTSSLRKQMKITLFSQGKKAFETISTIGPGFPFSRETTVPDGIKPFDLELIVSAGDKNLIVYKPQKPKKSKMPPPVTPPLPPEKISTNEELYLTGLRMEQFHNPSRDPYLYYQEVLKRDPHDSRVNTALAILYLKRGMYAEAEFHLNKALDRLTNRYTYPQNCEAYYYLGEVLYKRGKIDESMDSFHQAAWSPAWHSAALYKLAEIECFNGNFKKAKLFIDRSLTSGAYAAKTIPLRAILLRKTQNQEAAVQLTIKKLNKDPLDFWAGNEHYLALKEVNKIREADTAIKKLIVLMRDNTQNYLELACDYSRCGLWPEAIDVLGRITKSEESDNPLLYYYTGYYQQQSGKKDMAIKCFQQAALCSPDFCFPFRLETLNVLKCALSVNPKDARALYYLGNCLFEKQPEKAIEHWESSRALDPDFFMTLRNLGLAYARINNKIHEGINCLEKALALNRTNARLFYEIDLLYEAVGENPEKRLALLESNLKTVKERDDAFTRYISLLIQLGRYEDVIEILLKHHFHLWEGGGRIHNYYVDVYLLQGHQEYLSGNYKKALEDFKKADKYPLNLEVGRPIHGGQSSKIQYYRGAALDMLNEKKAAIQAFKHVASSDRGWSELSYFQGMALKKIGRRQASDIKFKGMIEYASECLKTSPAMDFFTKFGEKQSAAKRNAGLYYLAGLGYLGLGQKQQAKNNLQKALDLNPNFYWAEFFLTKNGI